MNAFLTLASIVHCYVGCNVGSPDRQGIHVLACDTETGAARIVQSVKGIQDSTYFELDREEKYLYSIVAEKKPGRKSGTVVRFPLDGWRLGPMERLADLPSEAPCHVTLTPDGRRVAVAAYSSAVVSTVRTDGQDLKSVALPDDAMGPNRRRQEKAHAHQVFNVGRGGVLGVVDLGCDRIRFFDPVTLERTSLPDIRFDAGDGPRHAVWSKDGRFLFVTCELSSDVYSFAFDGKAFRRVGKWTMLPSGTKDSWASAIKLTDDGKILMASNRGHESIAFYDVNTADGTLKLRNIAKLTGRFPRDFELMPGEKFMVVGHERSDNLQVYRFDRAACALTPVGDPIAAWHPLCFKFKPSKQEMTR